MSYETLVHKSVWKELPRNTHEAARVAFKDLGGLDHPSQHPNVKPLRESRYLKSFRLRMGRYRVLFTVLPDERAIVFTVAFMERRKEDYSKAVRLHDSRLRAYE